MTQETTAQSIKSELKRKDGRTQEEANTWTILPAPLKINNNSWRGYVAQA
jgi:hypothetical protein